MRRYALIQVSNHRQDNKNVIDRYLPDNYSVTYTDNSRIIISGDDVAGWTLQGYVIPRLASGNIVAMEINFDEALRIAGMK